MGGEVHGGMVGGCVEGWMREGRGLKKCDLKVFRALF